MGLECFVPSRDGGARKRGLLRSVALGAIASAAMLPMGSPARADCALSLTTVTCAPPGTGAYDHPFQDNLTINVQSGATVNDDGTAGILVQNGNTITNDGTVQATGGADGIEARDNNKVTNNGSIQVVNGNAIELFDNAALPANPNVTNNGTITVTGGGKGIVVGVNHRIVNNGTIDGGTNGGFGIVADSGSDITNNGSISVGAFASAVQMRNADNHLFNFGTIAATGGGLAIDICSCATVSTVENKSGGTIDGYIFVDGKGNTLTNSGLIQVTGSPLQGYPTFLIANQTGFPPTGAGNSFVQNASGTLALRMDNTGLIDNLSADAITAHGTVKIVIQNQLYQNQTFSGTAIGLTPYGAGTLANTIGSAFDHYTASSPFFTVTPIYDNTPTNYTALSFQLDRIPFGSVPGLNPNQTAVGKALENGYSPNLTGNAAIFYANLFSATSTSTLDQLSGQGTSAAQGASFTAGNLFNVAMLQQGMLWLNGGGTGGTTFGGVSQYAASNRLENKPGYDAFAAVRPQANELGRWRAWGLGFGGYHSIEGQSTNGTIDQSQRTYGGAVGVDHQISGDVLVGFAAGGSGTTFSAPALSTSGRIDGGHVGLYMVKTFGRAYLAATVNYGRLDNTTQRTISGVGPTENASGRFASDQVGGRVELGRKYEFGRYAVTPFAAVEPAALWQHAYTETSTTAGGGGGVMGLSYSANTVTSLPTFLGAELDTKYVLAGGHELAPFTRVSWVHEFETERQISASFTSVPGTGFTIDGARPSADAVRFESGGTLTLTRAASVFANLESEYSDRSRSYTGTGGVKVVW